MTRIVLARVIRLVALHSTVLAQSIHIAGATVLAMTLVEACVLQAASRLNCQHNRGLRGNVDLLQSLDHHLLRQALDVSQMENSIYDVRRQAMEIVMTDMGSQLIAHKVAGVHQRQVSSQRCQRSLGTGEDRHFRKLARECSPLDTGIGSAVGRDELVHCKAVSQQTHSLDQ
jgi:hypothetical protein